MPTSRGIRPPTILLACKLREKSSIVELVLRLSKYHNHLNRVGVNLPDEIVMFFQSHCHQATKSFVMNYKGIDMIILEISAMFDIAKVEIKKNHQLLMVNETTSLKKGKGKVEPKPETKCFYNKGNSHWSRITLDTW